MKVETIAIVIASGGGDGGGAIGTVGKAGSLLYVGLWSIRACHVGITWVRNGRKAAGHEATELLADEYARHPAGRGDR